MNTRETSSVFLLFKQLHMVRREKSVRGKMVITDLYAFQCNGFSDNLGHTSDPCVQERLEFCIAQQKKLYNMVAKQQNVIHMLKTVLRELSVHHLNTSSTGIYHLNYNQGLVLSACKQIIC